MENINSTFIFIGRQRKVSPRQVVLIEGESNYTKLYLSNGKTVILASTLKKMETRLATYGFFRTHKSFLINLSYITGYDFPFVRMNNNIDISISRRRRAAFQENLEVNISMIKNRNFT